MVVVLSRSPEVRRPTAADGPAWAEFLAEAQALTYRDLAGPRFVGRSPAEVQTYGEQLAATFAVEDGTIHRLAVRDDHIVAVASAGPAPSPWEVAQGHLPAPADWQLQRLYLHPEVHGTGLADVLMAEVLPEPRPTYLWIIEGNERAGRFYRKRGFVALDESFPAGESWGSLPMRRMLRPA